MKAWKRNWCEISLKMRKIRNKKRINIVRYYTGLSSRGGGTPPINITNFKSFNKGSC